MAEAQVQLEGIKYPGQHDFLLGRGGETNNHSGNILFRQFIRDCKEAYQTAPKTQKPVISQRLVSKWRNQDPPGRFLERCEDDKTWKDVGDPVACRKTSKALGERGKRSKMEGEEDPASPGTGAAPKQSTATVAVGTKRKMGHQDNRGAQRGGPTLSPHARGLALLNAATSRSAGHVGVNPSTASMASILQRMTGGVALAPGSAAHHQTSSLGDLSSLLRAADNPVSSPTPTTTAALLLANLQQQQQQQQRRHALLSAAAAAPAQHALPQHMNVNALLNSIMGGSIPSAAPTISSAPSSTPLADALALAMNRRYTAAPSADQLMDVTLARHILAQAQGSTGAALSGAATAFHAEAALATGEVAQRPQAQAPAVGATREFELLRLLAVNKLTRAGTAQGSLDPVATLAAAAALGRLDTK